MAALSHAHSLVNAVLGPLGLQLERKSARMPDAPELLPRLLSDCPVLASQERIDLLDTRWMVRIYGRTRMFWAPLRLLRAWRSRSIGRTEDM